MQNEYTDQWISLQLGMQDLDEAFKAEMLNDIKGEFIERAAARIGTQFSPAVFTGVQQQCTQDISKGLSYLNSLFPGTYTVLQQELRTILREILIAEVETYAEQDQQ